MAARQTFTAVGAPAAIGPYCHAVRAGELLFCSGQIPLDPHTGELVGETAGEQARRCMENLQVVCDAAGTSLARAVRLTIYMTDLQAFAEVNEAYGLFTHGRSSRARVMRPSPLNAKDALDRIDAIVAL